jgi:signal transduction histidine kinase/ligand-binding sensor domain-containing protein
VLLFLLLIVYLFAPQYASAQPLLRTTAQPLPAYLYHPYRFWHINTEKGGLSQNTVFAALQDRKGFLWLATGDGLNRYDGHSCKVFRHIPGDSTSLPSRQIFSLLEDSDGNLWCGTDRELLRFIPQTGTFEYFDGPSRKSKTQHTAVYKLFEDKKQRIWMSLGIGLYVLDKKDKRLKPASALTSSNKIFDTLSVEFLENTQKRFIIRYYYKNTAGETRAGYSELDTHNDTFVPVNILPKANNEFLHSVLLDSKEISWVHSVNPEKMMFTRYSQYQPEIQQLRQSNFFPKGLSFAPVYEDAARNYWFVENTSVRIFNPTTKRTDTMRLTKGAAEGLQGNTIINTRGIAYKHGKYYISTDGGGVNLFLPTPKFYHISRKNETVPNQLSANMLWGMAEDSAGYVWIATIGGGINRFNPSTGEIRSFLGTSIIRPVLCDRDGSIWASAQGIDKGHLLVHITNTASENPHIEKISIPPMPELQPVYSITQDRFGQLWCGVYAYGVFRFNPQAKAFSPLYPELGTYLSTDSKGRIWAGAGTVKNTGGFTVFDPADIDRIRFSGKDSTPQFFSHIPHNPANTHTPSDSDVRYFHEDSDGTMWIATIRGLDHFDPVTKRFTHYNEQSGMPNSYIYGILPDDNGNLWVSTNRGLSKFNKTSKTWRNYSPYDGLQSYEFDRSSFVRLRKGGTDGRMKGWMLFGGVNGFNIFHPDSVRDNPDKPPVAITNILINEKPYSEIWQGFQKDSPQHGIAEVSELTALELTWTDNTLGFEFAALEFTDPEKNRYAYQMEGIDKGWVQAGTLRTARYAGLQPGEYVFRVKACNNDGVWNEDGTRLSIRIVPPFWRTAWFYGLSMMLVLGSTVGGTRLVLRRRLEQRLKEERFARQLERERLEKALELERERQRISQDIHDEVGSGLTKILLLSQRGEETDVPRGEITATAQGVIEGMQEIIWAINPKNDTLTSLVAFIRSYGRDFVETAGMKFAFDVPKNLPSMPLRTDVRRNVFLAVKEALNNAVKYSAAAEVRILLETQADAYIFTIADNGKGFEPDLERLPTVRGGNGLANMLRRMEDIGGNFRVESAPNEGTKVIITLEWEQYRPTLSKA